MLLRQRLGALGSQRQVGVGGVDVARVERVAELRLRERRAGEETARVDEVDRDVGAARRVDGALGVGGTLLIVDEARRDEDHGLAAAHRREPVDGALERRQRGAVPGRGLLVDRVGADGDLRRDQPDQAAPVLGLEALVGGEVGRLLAEDAQVLPTPLHLVGDDLVLERRDPVRLVVAHLLERRDPGAKSPFSPRTIRSSSARPAGIRACQRSELPGATSDTEIAVLELAVDEAGERGLGAIAFGLRQVEVVEEEHEGARRPGVDPGVGAVAEASRRALRLARDRGGADGLEERDRLRPALVLDLEVGGGEIADRLAVLVDDDGVDDDQVGAGAKGGLSRRPLRLLGAEPGGERGTSPPAQERRRRWLDGRRIGTGSPCSQPTARS